MECENCPYHDYGLGGQYCEKTGGKTSLYGYCTDAYNLDVEVHKNCSKQKRRNKRERDQKHKNHLKFIAENVSVYPSPAIYVDEIYIKGQGYIQTTRPYYKRCYREKRAKYIKNVKQDNQKI